MSANHHIAVGSKQASSNNSDIAWFRVLDVIHGPYGSLTLKLRFDSGELPRIRKLLNTTLTAMAPGKQKSFKIKIEGFPVFGGKPSADRLYRTGRIDFNVSSSDEGLTSIRPGWQISIPLG
jgi:hypothetical protein